VGGAPRIETIDADPCRTDHPADMNQAASGSVAVFGGDLYNNY
jgi:hypothetical protein